MKTAEEIAKELYPDSEYRNAIEVRKAFVKGYQRRCLEEHTEMGEHAKQEKGGKLREAAERLIRHLGDCRYDHNGFCQEHFLESDCMVAKLKQALNENN